MENTFWCLKISPWGDLYSTFPPETKLLNGCINWSMRYYIDPFKNSHMTRMKAYSQPKFMGVLLKKKKKDVSYWTCTCTMHPLIYKYIYIYIFFFEQLYNLVHEIRPPSNKMATWLEWKLTQPKFLVVIQRMYYYMKNDKVIIIFII